MPAVTRVGAGVEAVILTADTHAVTEMATTTAAAAADARALGRLRGTIGPVAETSVATVTTAIAAIAAAAMMRKTIDAAGDMAALALPLRLP
jgi:hypothetical protein